MKYLSAAFAALVFAVTLCMPANAKNLYEISALYNQKRYKEVRLLFEANHIANWRDPNAAYYYALSLNALGQTHSALNVCKEIQQRYPKAHAAALARAAISLWSVNPPKPEHDLGMIGLKFVSQPGMAPEIRTIFSGTPAEESGLKIGDFIDQIETVPTLELSKEEVYRLLTGEPDSFVSMTIRRGNSSFTKKLKRMHSAKFAEAHPDIWKLYLEGNH